MIAHPVPLPPPTNDEPRTVKVFFDGGMTPTQCAAGAFVSPSLWRQKKIGGPARTAYLAEVIGSRLAIDLMIEIAADVTVGRLQGIGDNYAVISSLAADLAVIKSVPGRSPCPGAWKAALTQLETLQNIIAKRASPLSVEWIWVPRRYNVNADEICNACMQDRPPVFRTDVPPPPTRHDEPSADELEKIFKKIATSTPNSIRTLPPFLKPLWLQALSRIAAWSCGPQAILAAPRVLLARRAGDLRERLALLAKRPLAVEDAFFLFANDDGEEEPAADAPKSRSTDVDWKLVERVAAQAPAKAVKLLEGRALVADDTVGRRQLDDKRGAHDDDDDLHQAIPEPEGVTKPPWMSATTALAIAATGLARLASPASDGWTRELFLASVSKATAATWEVALNSMARGEVPGEATTDPTRVARVALWQKSAGSQSLRIIGMTSAIAKIAWRYVTGIREVALGNQAAFSRGGVHTVTRWAAALPAVYVGDVVDAYWHTRRHVVMQWLVQRAHPAAWMVWRQYASRPQLMWRGELLEQRRGVLPGCGGAAFMFSVDMCCVTASLADPPRPLAETWLYVDDAASSTRDAFAAFVRACRKAGKEISKGRIIGASVAEEIEGVTMAALPAGRHLGAIMGATEPAASAFREHALAKIEKLDRLAATPLSVQAKWQIFRSVEKSLVWDCTATRPTVVAAVAPELDDRLDAFVRRVFLPPEAELTHDSMALSFLPNAHGGLGRLRIAGDCELLYNVATSRLNVVNDGDRVGMLNTNAVRKVVNEAKIELARDKSVRLNRRKDETVPWFDIQATTARTKISDEAFRLGLANHIDATVPYATCSECTELPFDHSQCCHQCAGPYRYARHQRVQQEFINTATAFGIITTTNFYSIGADPKGERPDAIVFRGATGEIPLLFDFSIPHQRSGHIYDASGKQHAAKRRKYRNFLQNDPHAQPTVEFAPFIVSTRGAIHPKTVQRIIELQKVATRKGFVYELTRRVKCAVIEFEIFRKGALMMRKANGILLPRAKQATDSSDDETEGDDDVDNTTSFS